jgi:hypothetical protein
MLEIAQVITSTSLLVASNRISININYLVEDFHGNIYQGGFLYSAYR